MHKVYTRINWENVPSEATPINETNLNRMDYALNEIDGRVVAFDTSKAEQSDLLQTLKTVSYDSTTGVFTFTFWNGTTVTADLNIEKIPVSFSMDANGIITMTTSDGSTYTADVGSLIKTYTFNDSTDIDFNVVTDSSGNKTVTATIVDGSVTARKLQPNYLADIQAEVASAQAYANSASGSATTAGNQALEAEAWADGQKNGVDVPSTAQQYHNNAKYWAEQAQQASGGGHIIVDENGTPYPSQSNLQFVNASVSNDSANNATVVTISNDSSQNTVTYTSGDDDDTNITPSTGWTTVAKMTSAETLTSLFNKVSTMFKNTRWLFKMLGTTPIPSACGTDITSAISYLNTTLAGKNDTITHKAAYGPSGTLTTTAGVYTTVISPVNLGAGTYIAIGHCDYEVTYTRIFSSGALELNRPYGNVVFGVFTFSSTRTVQMDVYSGSSLTVTANKCGMLFIKIA